MEKDIHNFTNLSPYVFVPTVAASNSMNEDDDDDDDDDEQDQSGNLETVDQSEIMYPKLEYDYQDNGNLIDPKLETPDYQNMSYVGKKKKSKKIKAENGVEEEDVRIENYIHLDAKNISVKIMRKLIPKLRVACYYSDYQVNGKKKMKHLWDHKPTDWPDHVPFKDPNNGSGSKEGGNQPLNGMSSYNPQGGNPSSNGMTSFGSMPPQGPQVKKPGKKELALMYNFLKSIYMSESKNSYNSEQPTDSMGDDRISESRPTNGEFYPYNYPSNGVNVARPCQQECNDNSVLMVQLNTQSQASVNGMKATESYPEGQLAPSQHVFVPTMIQQQMTLAQTETFVLPDVVVELNGRLRNKMERVFTLSENNSTVSDILLQTHSEVLDKLYSQINSSDAPVCLMFVDAGHQMEALLDVMLVLNRVEVALLRNGCQEIIKKFKTESVGCVLYEGLVQPRLSTFDTSALATASAKLLSELNSVNQWKGFDLFDEKCDPFKMQFGLDPPPQMEEFDMTPLFRPRDDGGLSLIDQIIEKRLPQPPVADQFPKDFLMLLPDNQTSPESESSNNDAMQNATGASASLQSSGIVDSPFSSDNNTSLEAGNAMEYDSQFWMDDVCDIIAGEFEIEDQQASLTSVGQNIMDHRGNVEGNRGLFSNWPTNNNLPTVNNQGLSGRLDSLQLHDNANQGLMVRRDSLQLCDESRQVRDFGRQGSTSRRESFHSLQSGSHARNAPIPACVEDTDYSDFEKEQPMSRNASSKGVNNGNRRGTGYQNLK